jgi:cytochrome c-type biogenesis protein CcmH
MQSNISLPVRVARALVTAAYAVLLLASGVARADAPDVSRVAARARALETRLLAPCCWDQTLDVHDSDVARALHREITERLEHAEPADAVERDLVARYGERIRAVPPSSPLPTVALVTLLLIFLAGGALWLVARRWRDAGCRASGGAGHGPTESTEGLDHYDAQITRELAER